jgi:hypothetical protein
VSAQTRPTVRAMHAVIPEAARPPAWERRDTKRIPVAELEVLHAVVERDGWPVVKCDYGTDGCDIFHTLAFGLPCRSDREKWKARAIAAEGKVADLAAHIRRLEDELGHAPDGSGAV